MITMGCALCREQRTIDHLGSAPLPQCDKHPERAMVDWNYLSKYPKDTLLGEIVDHRYVLVRPLGEGGFGSVYFAIQRGQIRRPVAIKFLTRLNPEFEELFRDEMRVMTRLRNQHVVQFLDSGSHQSSTFRQTVPYMVMEFIAGKTLAEQMITLGPLPPVRVLTLFRQLLKALVEAHEYGIIHRDLKPLNLMMSHERGGDLRLVVLDFGVARMADENTRDATRNKIMGTPYYLAPEVLLKGEITHQTDLFAAAVIAYEALCFKSPFLNEELPGIEPYVRLRNLYKDDTSPNPLPDHFPPEWGQFFKCALACDPQKRFPNASAMLIALEELEKRTQTAHSNLELESDPFAEDAKTKMFKKQLMKMSKRLQKHASDQRQQFDSVDESISVLESVFESAYDQKEDNPNESSLSQKLEQSLTQKMPSLPKASPPPLPPMVKKHNRDPLKSVIDQLHHEKSDNSSSQSLLKPSHLRDGFGSQVQKVDTREKLPINHIDKYRAVDSAQGIKAEHKVAKQLSEDETLHLNVDMKAENMPTIQVGSVSPLITNSRVALKKKNRSTIAQRNINPKPNMHHQSTHQRSSGLVIWLQLLIMVGLGIGFAYVVANYILN